MANIIYNIFKENLAEGTYRWNTVPDVDVSGSRVKVVLMATAADTSDSGQDIAILSTVVSGKEYGGTYTRPTLDGVVVVNDSVSNHAELDADDEVVAVGSGGTVVGLVVFIDPTGSSVDGSCVPVCYMDVTSFVGNGSDVTFVWNAEGLMKLT